MILLGGLCADRRLGCSRGLSDLSVDHDDRRLIHADHLAAAIAYQASGAYGYSRGRTRASGANRKGSDGRRHRGNFATRVRVFPQWITELDLSRRTVEIHRAHIHRKLAMRTRAELVRYALDRHLIGVFLDAPEANYALLKR